MIGCQSRAGKGRAHVEDAVIFVDNNTVLQDRMLAVLKANDPTTLNHVRVIAAAMFVSRDLARVACCVLHAACWVSRRSTQHATRNL